MRSENFLQNLKSNSIKLNMIIQNWRCSILSSFSQSFSPFSVTNLNLNIYKLICFLICYSTNLRSLVISNNSFLTYLAIRLLTHSYLFQSLSSTEEANLIHPYLKHACYYFLKFTIQTFFSSLLLIFLSFHFITFNNYRL